MVRGSDGSPAQNITTIQATPADCGPGDETLVSADECSVNQQVKKSLLGNDLIRWESALAVDGRCFRATLKRKQPSDPIRFDSRKDAAA